MDIQDIFVQIKSAIVDACDLEPDDVTMNKTLIEDLGIDSIDLMDIIYDLEQKFKVQIEIGNFEKLAQDKMQDKELHEGGIITKDGLEVLKNLMPEVPKEKFSEGLTIYKIPYLFTVHSLCNLVKNKIESK